MQIKYEDFLKLLGCIVIGSLLGLTLSLFLSKAIYCVVGWWFGHDIR